GVAYENDAAAGAWNGTLDQQEVLLSVDSVNGQVLSGNTLSTHTTSHLLSTENATWGRCAADGTWLTVVLVSTVRCANTVEVVTLHNAGEALTLRGTNDVDLLAGFEDLYGKFLACGVLSSVCGAQFYQVATWGDACSLEVTSQWLGDLARIDLAVADLNCGVAIALFVDELGDNVAISLHDGDRNQVEIG